MKKTAKYKEPPLVEVVCGVQFRELQRFAVVHAGKLWDSLDRKKYTEVKEAPVVTKMGLVEPRIEIFSGVGNLPRLWFVHQDKHSLVQFQKDRFWYNWRKLDKDGKEKYPHYDEVFTRFFDNLQRVKKVISANELGDLEIEMAELTYINIIPFENQEDLRGLKSIFKDVAWNTSRRFLPPPENINYQASFNLPKIASKLYVTLQSAQNVSDGKRVFRLEISVKGQLDKSDKKSIKQWFDEAHKWVVGGFTDLTTPEMHKIWRKYA